MWHLQFSQFRLQLNRISCRCVMFETTPFDHVRPKNKIDQKKACNIMKLILTSEDDQTKE